MSNAPYLLPKARAAATAWATAVLDHMFLDGLEDAYDKGRLMGTFAEDCAQKLSVHARGAGRVRDRIASARARRANEDGTLQRRDRAGHGSRSAGRRLIDDDEQPLKADAGENPVAEAGVSARTARSPPRTPARSRRRGRARADAPLAGASSGG